MINIWALNLITLTAQCTSTRKSTPPTSCNLHHKPLRAPTDECRLAVAPAIRRYHGPLLEDGSADPIDFSQLGQTCLQLEQKSSEKTTKRRFRHHTDDFRGLRAGSAETIPRIGHADTQPRTVLTGGQSQTRTGEARATCICRGCTRAMRLAERAALGRCARTALRLAMGVAAIIDAITSGYAERSGCREVGARVRAVSLAELSG